MMWIQFVGSSVVIVLAAVKLAEYGDVIAVRTRLGGLFVGTLLMAGATSLPEVLTSLNSLSLNEPNLAAGNLLGSNMFNMFLLAILDMASRKERVLRNAALKHALSGSLAILLIGLVLFFTSADIDVRVGWIGADSLVLMAVYVAAMRLIRQSSSGAVDAPGPVPVGTPSLAVGVVGFLAAAAMLVVATPVMVRSSAAIAEATGLGTTFVGTTLVAMVTSLPELVTTIAALRIGAPDMAIGNLFGSNMFNMLALGLTDVFYTPGRYLAAIDPALGLVALLGLVMTCMALIGNLARLERRVLFMEIDALGLMLVYFGGLWLLYTRGVSP